MSKNIRSTRFLRAAGFRLCTVWLFTYSDMKTIIVPKTAFGILSAISSPMFNLPAIPLLLILRRFPWPSSGAGSTCSPSRSTTSGKRRLSKKTPSTSPGGRFRLGDWRPHKQGTWCSCSIPLRFWRTFCQVVSSSQSCSYSSGFGTMTVAAQTEIVSCGTRSTVQASFATPRAPWK